MTSWSSAKSVNELNLARPPRSIGMTNLSRLKGWLELRSVKGLGPITFSRLFNHFGSPEAIQSATFSDLVAAGDVSPAFARAIQQPLPSETQHQIERELMALEKGKFHLFSLLDQEYPSRLKMIPDPPPLIYSTGQLAECDHHALALVGSRNATHQGKAFTRRLSANLASLGFTIVSGLARGIDSAAHEGALSSSGRTVAVLGCGIDKLYPPEHRSLRRQIENQGAILSEFPIGTPPHPSHFPQRNRLISGLSLGVIVTEASSQSGSLITARFATEQNREIFAVPGNVSNALSRGPHHLIKQGAKLVEEPSDVVEEILPMLEPSFREHVEKQQSSNPSQSSTVALGPEEQQVLKEIALEPISLDALLAQVGFSPSEIMSVLLSLEIKGLIKQLPGLQYVRVDIR